MEENSSVSIAFVCGMIVPGLVPAHRYVEENSSVSIAFICGMIVPGLVPAHRYVKENSSVSIAFICGMIVPGLDPAHRYVEENRSAAILAAMKFTGVTPEVNLKEHVAPSTNMTAHFGFQTQRRYQQKGISGLTKGLISSQKLKSILLRRLNVLQLPEAVSIFISCSGQTELIEMTVMQENQQHSLSIRN